MTGWRDLVSRPGFGPGAVAGAGATLVLTGFVWAATPGPSAEPAAVPATAERAPAPRPLVTGPPPTPLPLSATAPATAAGVRGDAGDEEDGVDQAGRGHATSGEGEDPWPALPAATGALPPGLPSGEPVRCPAPTVRVGTADELHAALAAARPGDVIGLDDGVYRGSFVAQTSGTAHEPVWLCGGPEAVLDGGDAEEGGYVLHLDPAQYWRVVGFTVRNGQKGVMADGTRRTVIQGLTVTDIGDEGIHLRSASTHNAVLGNTIRRTGLRKEKFGEGIYIGSAESNWDQYGGGGPDRSDSNLVQGNTITETTSESIDVKEGTSGGALVGNRFDGSRITGADSWVDVKGRDWVVQGNVGRNSPLDGFQTHEIVDGWGTRNVFRSNIADVEGEGVAFSLTPVRDNVVACDNRASSGAPASSNVDCSS